MISVSSPPLDSQNTASTNSPNPSPVAPLLNDQLLLAAFHNLPTSVEDLISQGADINYQDPISGHGALHFACFAGHLQVLKLLYGFGAQIDLPDVEGCTPLHNSSFQGRLECVRFLLNVGVDVNYKDIDGSVPLHKAAFKGECEIVELLLRKGADVNAIDSGGISAIQKSAQNNQPQVLQILLDFAIIRFKDSQSELNSKTPDNESPSKDSNPNKTIDLQPPFWGPRDKKSNTPLHRASFVGSLDCVKVLLDSVKNCSPNEGKKNVKVVLLKDEGGVTPIHCASFKGHTKIIKLLLETLEDDDPSEKTDWKDNQGKTPLDYARDASHQDCILIFQTWLSKKMSISTTKKRSLSGTDPATSSPATRLEGSVIGTVIGSVLVGKREGSLVGKREGSLVGKREGSLVGKREGSLVGNREGSLIDGGTSTNEGSSGKRRSSLDKKETKKKDESPKTSKKKSGSFTEFTKDDLAPKKSSPSSKNKTKRLSLILTESPKTSSKKSKKLNTLKSKSHTPSTFHAKERSYSTSERFTKTDRFGFVQTLDQHPSSDSNLSFSSSSSSIPTKHETIHHSVSHEQRREMKWVKMIQNANYSKLEQRCMKGIPESVRTVAWPILLNIPQIRIPLLYQTLLTTHLTTTTTTSTLEEIIERDIGRTFPLHFWFMERGKNGQQQLYNVLVAYGRYNPIVGYCQGMAFVAGILLMYMTEEDAFWGMVQLGSEAKEDVEIKGFKMGNLWKPGLPGLARNTFILEKLVKKYLPNLEKHFEKEKIILSMFAVDWFITVFSYNMKPFELCLRIYDVMLVKGYEFVVFGFAMQLLKTLEGEVVKREFERALKILKLDWSWMEREMENGGVLDVEKMMRGTYLWSKKISKYLTKFADLWSAENEGEHIITKGP